MKDPSHLAPKLSEFSITYITYIGVDGGQG
jgi:hypothetical protein